VLRLGSTGNSVRQLQEQLGRLRLYTGPVDGHYNHDVAAAVARMQQARAIPEPLGVYGPGTREAISAAAM
jgi:peptidoglycan hydrolase-like protein with peptidoglycan-binding domain